MKRTENLSLPIYDNPESDIFKINDVNNAHETIDKQYKELKNIKETVESTNPSANLQGQINDINASLDKKANDDVVVKKGYATLNDFDEETRRVIQGMEPGEINAVLGNRNVKFTNTDFVEAKPDDSPFTPIDLYDRQKVSEAGYFAGLSDGVIVNTQYTKNYMNTGYIKCYSSVRYVLYAVPNLCMYDKDKNFIQSISDTNSLEAITVGDISGKLLNVPENCEYIICNVYVNSADLCHIWQLDRYQSPADCTLTIPRLDLYKNSIFTINGKEAIDNNINLTATDLGAVEQLKKLISENLPFTIDSNFKKIKGVINTTDDLGEDTLIAKSINEFNINSYSYSSALCNYVMDTENYNFTLTSNGQINGWFQCYMNIPVNGLTGGAEYTLYTKIRPLSGYIGDNRAKGITIFNSSMESLTSGNQWAEKLTFTVPDDGNIVIRFYPSNIAHDGSTNLVCKFENIMLCKNNQTLTTFVPYSKQEVQLKGNSNVSIDLSPLITIETEKNIYNNNIKVYAVVEAGKVSTVNDYIPDEYGNVSIPKTIISGKKIVCFGDSVTEFGTYPQQVGDILGATTYNVGVGGCRMSYHPDHGYDGFSMTKLANAIVSKDFSLQEQCLNELIGIGDDNTKSYETLININFEEIDYVTIAFGTNDFGGSVSLGNINSEANNSTFYGSIKYVIETILTAYPHIKLFFMTPIFRWAIPGAGNNSDITPKNGHYLNDYAKAIIDVCYKYHIPVLDMYNKSNINALNHTYYISSDGTHPTEEGYKLIAEKLSKFLLSN